jgi:hypothetical protein
MWRIYSNPDPYVGLSLMVKERRWIGNVLGMQPDSILKFAMIWTPPGRGEEDQKRHGAGQQKKKEQGWKGDRSNGGPKTGSCGELW